MGASKDLARTDNMLITQLRYAPVAILLMTLCIQVHGFYRPYPGDADLDGISDLADPCPYTPGTACGQDYDLDDDGITDLRDNCPYTPNVDQSDIDNDMLGDACDADNLDADGDTVVDSVDNCPVTTNPEQSDVDEDGIGDACDTVLDPIPDLTIIARGATQRSWSRAGRLEFLIVNQGPLAAENVVVELDLTEFINARSYFPADRPTGLGWTCSAFNFSNPISTCTRPSIAAAGSGDASTQLSISLGGITNGGVVSFEAEITAGDNLPANNQVNVAIEFTPPQVDLSLQANPVNVAALAEGAISRYFFIGVNAGPEPDNNYIAEYSLSGPAEFVRGRMRYLRSNGFENQSVCSIDGPVMTCPRILLQAGATVNFSLDLAGTDSAGEVTIVAQVSSNANDVSVENNNTELNIPVLDAPVLNQVQRVDTAGSENIPGPDTDFAISADGAYFYAANSDTNAISIFTRDAASGLLAFQQHVVDNEAGIWRRQLAISPDDEHLYLLTSERDNFADSGSRALRVYTRDLNTGNLNLVQTLMLSDLGIPQEYGPNDLQISTDGTKVYAQIARRLLYFTRNPTTGLLGLQQDIADADIIAFTIHANGIFLSRPAQQQLSRFSHDPQTGLLSEALSFNRTQGVDTFWPSSHLVVTQSNQLLTADNNLSAGGHISVLNAALNSATEQQWWLDYHFPTGLNAFQITPDQQFLFATGEDPDIIGNSRYFITVAEQDVSCGELTLRESYGDNTGATHHLFGARRLLVSPDNSHLYAAALGILVFEIDSDRDGLANGVDPETSQPSIQDCTADRDSDGDGATNTIDLFPLDPQEREDQDNDFVGDAADNCPAVANEEQVDTDRDLVGDACDADDDNDGTADLFDDLPFDPAEQLDTDGDGIGNNADPDDDSDAWQDIEDNCPVTANPTQLDTDEDGAGDACDTDDDGDGRADTSDAFPLDPTETHDTDRDGIGNNADPDDDNDGISDVEEIAAGSNPLVDEKKLAAILLILQGYE